jgi:hypothetical protein
MSVPAPRRPRHANGRWETIRYALDSNARTFRLCLIVLMTAISPVAATVIAVLVHHVLLYDQLRPGSTTQAPGGSGAICPGSSRLLLWAGHARRTMPRGLL